MRGSGAEPLFSGHGTKLPKAERFTALEWPKEAAFSALYGSSGDLKTTISLNWLSVRPGPQIPVLWALFQHFGEGL